MIEANTGTRRTAAHEDARPYRFVGLERFAVWGQATDAIVPFARGTEGDDTFTGTDGDDRYLGLGGNDTLDGGGGLDHLFGGDGDDTIDGGKGDDVLSGGAGHDVIHCGAGNDRLKIDEANGNDIIYGEKGDDILLGGVSDDTLYGGAGNDYCSANFAVLIGGAGDDTLIGSGCLMKGGAGNDTLRVGGAFQIDEYSHEVWGGSGADTFIFGSDGYLGGGYTIIYDLSNEDVLDMSLIDGKANQPGKQDLELVPEYNGKSGIVTVSYDAPSDRTLILIFTDNDDRQPDGTIIVPGDHADFVNFVF